MKQAVLSGIIAIFTLLLFTNCGDKNESSTHSNETNPLIGEWLEEATLSTESYYSTGALFSAAYNIDGQEYIHAEGNWSANNNKIYGALSMGGSENAFESEIIQLTALSLVRKDITNGGNIYKMGKVVSTKNMGVNESVALKYIIPNGYTAEKSCMPWTVMLKDGVITASDCEGVAYISMKSTTNETAYLKIIVGDGISNFLWGNSYESLLGMSYENISSIFGEAYTYDNKNDIATYLPNPSDESSLVDIFAIKFDETKENAQLVSIMLKASLSEQKILDFLHQKYNFDKAEEDVYQFLNNTSYSNSDFIVYFYPEDNIVSFQQLSAISRPDDSDDRLWPDYAKVLGMDAQQLKSTYGAPQMEEDDHLGYVVDNDYINVVMFYLNEKAKVKSIFLEIKEQVSTNTVCDFISTEYIMGDSEDLDEGMYIWWNKEATIGVVYDANNHILMYMSLEDIASTSTVLSRSFRQIEQQIMEHFRQKRFQK